jgi:acyl carrier protein
MIINQLEDEYDVEIPFLDFKRAKSIGGAVDLIVDLVEE